MRAKLKLLRTVFVNDTGFHYKHHTSHGCNVGKRIAIERDDVGLEAGSYRPDLIRHTECLRSE
jgi:hypothetical protein